MVKILQFVLMALLLVSTSGCGAKKLVGLDGTGFLGFGDNEKTAFKGATYPPTSQVAIAFQPSQVAASCRVFAEALVRLPAKVSGKDIENTILAEAGKRGAEQVLIGQSRQAEDDEGAQFLYFGPNKEYLCSEQCGGWKFGYSLWEEQGDWVNIGYKEWGNAGYRSEGPLVMQIVMLRCR